ncbi:reverse transcriptase domain-containing protein [Pseudooceanicola sp. MF1-13]|uniref:reverse transcriptase domain-containing protein n=1 Tax=Pseudooceanicola sp. MF1-13 TaxID=3379095 RepID=UPI00389280F9
MTEKNRRQDARDKPRRSRNSSMKTPKPVSAENGAPSVQPKRPKRLQRLTFARAERQVRKLNRHARTARALHEAPSSLSEKFVAGVALFEANEAILRSYSARLLAAREAIKDFDPREIEYSPAELARRMDAFAPCDEPVQLTLKPKPDGHFRPTLNFGVERRAQQILVRNLISVQFGERPWDQKLFNGGTKAAIEQIKANYEEGYKFACHLDVVECFSSFNVEKVAQELSLPEEVANNVLTGQNFAIEHSSTIREDRVPFNSMNPRLSEEYLEKARRGLSTGSKVSPLIADVMLSLVHIALVDVGDIKVTSFADNFMVQTRDRAMLRNAAHSLRDALQQHPAGPLGEHKVETLLAPWDPFEFLGYHLEPNGTRLMVTMSRDNTERARLIRANCYQELRAAICEEEISNIVLETDKKHRSLVYAFGAWTGRLRFHDKKMRKIRIFAKRALDADAS